MVGAVIGLAVLFLVVWYALEWARTRIERDEEE